MFSVFILHTVFVVHNPGVQRQLPIAGSVIHLSSSNTEIFLWPFKDKYLLGSGTGLLFKNKW